jgi:hypothetical protein
MNKYFSIFTTVAVFLVGCCIFSGIIFWEIKTDIQLHADKVVEILNGEAVFPPNFLYYFILAALSYFSTEKQVVYWNSVLLLSISFSFKFLVTRNLLKEFLQTEVPQLISNLKVDKLITLLAFALLFVFSLPNITIFTSKTFYLGQVPPNVWHNSTTIFLFPFALLLFWQSYKQLQHSSTRRLYLIFFLIILNILIKPSFFFVIAVVYPCFLLMKYRFNKIFIVNIIPIVVGGVFILAQYYLIYQLNMGSFQSNASGVAVLPLTVWSNFINPFLIPLAILTSTLFPLLLIISRPIKKPKILITYILALFIAGLILFVFVAETGPRKYHGNFSWQNIILNYIFFLVAVMYALKYYFSDVLNGKRKKVYRMMAGVFFLHFASGLLYLVKILAFKSYF